MTETDHFKIEMTRAVGCMACDGCSVIQAGFKTAEDVLIL